MDIDVEAILSMISNFYLLPMRFVFVLLAIGILRHLGKLMLWHGQSQYILAVLDVEESAIRLPITHYEITIGRSKSCDVVIPLAYISRQHAVLTMTSEGMWRIRDTKSSGGIFVNGEPLGPDALIGIGDEMTLSGVRMVLMPASESDASAIIQQRRERRSKWYYKLLAFFIPKKKKPARLNTALRYLNLFQIFAFIQLFLTADQEYYLPLAISFVFLFLIPWIYKPIAKRLGIKNMAAEAAAFYLTTMGICSTASAAPDSLYKQLGAIVLGLIIFCVMCGILKNLNIVMKLRRYAGAASFLVLAANIVFGANINGQRNWIRLGSITIQPSEFVKILFIFTGAATLEWLLTTKNLTTLVIYAGGCIGCLFVMGDFGTALIFFFTFIVLTYMTTGDVRAIVLTCVIAAMGATLILYFKPYILDRFSTWRNVWSDLDDTGYQQTRALMAIASGGLLGLGGGNGFVKRVYAADTDIVVGVVAEEWGMIIALTIVACYIFFMVVAMRSHQTSFSSYYVIAACAAAALFLFQAALNIFGTTDILPITGVTLPFVSNGGSSMSASWGLLSFITAALNYAQPKLKPTVAAMAVEIEE